MNTVWKVLVRKKVISPETSEETRLSRVLNTFDLTALGVGSTLGVGVYVLAGHVAKEVAGPAVVLSFLLAAVASVFAGLCYAEFGARVPRAGSAYIYSYVCVGEFVAFIIGWNLILEYVIGSASVARGLSLYLDTLINNTLQDTFREIAPIDIPYLSAYFDFFSFGVSIILAIALAFGLKESSIVNNIFTTINIFVVLFVIIAGSFKADTSNWSVNPENVTANSTDVGNGGFFPFGVEGMIKGAATCFYGFVGFDCIATTGEEVKNPKKAIPISIILSLFIIFLAYFGTSTVITLMVPYYLQNPNAPIPHAFEVVGWDWAKWIVAIGAIFGLCASLFGAMFPLPRIIYAMGSDSLVFKFLAKVHPRFQTPVIGTLLAGILTGLMSAMFELRQLVNMMSIGTLLAYTIVAASVLLLRYENEGKTLYIPVQTTSSDSESDISENNQKYSDKIDTRFSTNNTEESTSDDRELVESDEDQGQATCCSVLGQIFNCSRQGNPTSISRNIVAVELFVYCILCILLGLTAIYWRSNIVNGEFWAITVTSVIVAITVIVVMSLVTQPTSKKKLSFKVPLVPLIPALSILINIYLMLMLDTHTWIRFAVWMALGVPMYIYCVRNSCCGTLQKSGPNYSNNMTNGNTNKKLNGITNISFVYDQEQMSNHEKISESEIEIKPVKKGPAPVPPGQPTKQTSVVEIQPETVIAQLDEILDRADDSLEHNLLNTNRKLSVSTWSNMSVPVEPSIEKSVVADVHCNGDVSLATTPVVTSNASPLFTVSDKNLNNNNIDVITSLELVPPNEKIVLDSVQNDSVSDPLSSVISDNGSDHKENLDAVLTDGVTEDCLATIRLEGTKLQDVGSNSKSDVEISSANISNEDSDIHIATRTKPIETEIPLQKSVSDTIVPLTRDLLSDMDNSYSDMSTTTASIPSTSSTPTEVTLRSVTLRKTPKKVVEEPTNSDSGSESNLRVGSMEYNSFLAKLNNKLQTNPVSPTYLPAVVFDKSKLKNSVEKENEPPPVERNENIIEDTIDQREAKEKLRLFYENNYINPFSNPEEINVTKGENIYEEVTVPIKNDVELQQENVQENPKEIIKNLNKDTDGSKVSNDNISGELDDHRNKMQNVFRSMNLKRRDSSQKRSEEASKLRRLSKTLGTSFKKSDDKVEHRQKMDDVFKTIILRGRDGTQD